MGKLIVIEGLDGSGKSTQLARLPDSLSAVGICSRTVSFPDYESDSSALIKMYLRGDFGKKPGDVNGYAASVFYAADRYASFQQKWGNYYRTGGTVIAGRYTTSNAIHQCSKLPREEWKPFLDWLYDLEYGKIGIPAPDCVIFLDMDIEVSQKLLSGRYDGDEQKKDIHERDTDYLKRCREAAKFTAEYSGWQVISCTQDGNLRSVEEIGNEITERVIRVIRNG